GDGLAPHDVESDLPAGALLDRLCERAASYGRRRVRGRGARLVDERDGVEDVGDRIDRGLWSTVGKALAARCAAAVADGAGASADEQQRRDRCNGRNSCGVPKHISPLKSSASYGLQASR